jgi:hypothetical protein
MESRRQDELEKLIGRYAECKTLIDNTISDKRIDSRLGHVLAEETEHYFITEFVKRVSEDDMRTHAGSRARYLKYLALELRRQGFSKQDIIKLLLFEDREGIIGKTIWQEDYIGEVEEEPES